MIMSKILSDRANKVIPGGVNSPVRAWKAVGGVPTHIDRGKGCRLFTNDDEELVDFCGSWGPLILGHAHPEVLEAVRKTASKGLSFGATTELEIEIAELLCRQIPYFEKIRLVNSGTEAVMTAIRLARGYTQKDKILKFEGCYHGHSDFMLVNAGSGLLTESIASSAGVPHTASAHTLIAPYNDLASVREIIANHGEDLAAIIVEPVAGNMGLIKPEPGFLEGLREYASSCAAMLIFDEVITGFRLAPTTYGVIAGIQPDLTCLGKIIGGGMPIGAIAGKSDIMEHLAPLGPVYQAGTLSGNPVAVSAGLATLNVLISSPPYDEIAQKTNLLMDTLVSEGSTPKTDFQLVNLGGMFTIFFTDQKVKNLTNAKNCNTQTFADYFHHMRSKGFYLPPSQFEVCFVSAAHGQQEVENFARAFLEYISSHHTLTSG